MSEQTKTAAQLVKGVPGASSRRLDIIIALCKGSDVLLSPLPARLAAGHIVATANRILELTEQA